SRSATWADIEVLRWSIPSGSTPFSPRRWIHSRHRSNGGAWVIGPIPQISQNDGVKHRFPPEQTCPHDGSSMRVLFIPPAANQGSPRGSTPMPTHGNGSRRGKPVGAMSRAVEVFLVFLRLGLTSFGGPIAHIGYFREEFVVRRMWIEEASFADLVALCQFLP